MKSDIENQLKQAARAAAERAYCPYSGFCVGAAVAAEDGRIFAGANIENASYGLSMCAERVAIFQAVSAGARRLIGLAIYTPTTAPTTPCGACRQVLWEFAREATVWCACEGDESLERRVRELLPDAFTFLK